MKLVWILFLSFVKTSAIAQSFQVRDFLISFSHGYPYLPASYDIDYEEAIWNFKTTTGPFFAKVEYGVNQHWGIGGNFAYQQNETTWETPEGDFFKQEQSGSFNLRFNYHFQSATALDPYLGFGMGLRFIKAYKFYTYNSGDIYESSNTSNYSPFGFEATLGLRYSIKRVGIFLEMGIAKSPVQLGLTFRLNRRVSHMEDKE